MGVTIAIGEAEIEYSQEQYIFTSYICLVAKEVKGVDILCDKRGEELIEQTNHMKFPYAWFDGFCKVVGLFDFFNNGKTYRGGHSGYFAFGETELDYVLKARDKYLKNNPRSEVIGIIDLNLGTLDWLCFWMDWSIKYCERPIISNYLIIKELNNAVN